MKVLVATRSAHKLREIRGILRGLAGVELVSPEGLGLVYDPSEEGIEAFETFEENALAKAHWFHERSGLPALADDSGLEVDLLDGAPGVHSKRFAPQSDPTNAQDRDTLNNEHLLTLLGDAPLAERTARFVCVAVLVDGTREPLVARGEAPGLILGRPRGRDGFGYDPLFFDPDSGRTFAELSGEEKAARGHRGKAFREMSGLIREFVVPGDHG
ncbi:MAG: non-canonical purine NTP pyrophosphatase [Gemmatimonadales bacterium]|nr:MAG: non-canonical purine NTP pyrophosphatase [Gemmatimonadales bacterium]